MPDPIPYMTPTEDRWYKRKTWRIFIWIVAVLLLISLVPTPEVAEDSQGVCTICGSRISERTWLGRFTTNRVVTPSVLDSWITQNQTGHVHNWQFFSYSGRGLLGNRTGFGCATPPPIYDFTDSNLQTWYIQSASRTEIQQFVQTMQSGTAAQQEQAVKQAVGQGLDAPVKPIASRPAL